MNANIVESKLSVKNNEVLEHDLIGESLEIEFYLRSFAFICGSHPFVRPSASNKV